MSLATKKIAWNGVSLCVPEGWEVEKLDRDYMLIGDELGPGIEVKWGRLPGGAHFDILFKRFIKRARRKLGIAISPQRKPSWYHSSFESLSEHFFFSWRKAPMSGEGVVLFCRHCNRLTLIRFFPDHASGSQGSPAGDIIRSFRDHTAVGRVGWAIFGMVFDTPKEFRLNTFSFRPGSYALSFKKQRTVLGLYSWGPASFLLSGKTLSDFAGQRVAGIRGQAESGLCHRGPFLQWAYRKGNGLYRLPLFRHLDSHSVFRICRDDRANRILGVLTVSGSKFEHKLIEESFIGGG